MGKWFQARWFLAALVILDLSRRTNGYIICDPGYILVMIPMCVAGKYKQDSGNIPCRSCPMNSDSPAGTTAQGECKCNAVFNSPLNIWGHPRAQARGDEVMT